MDEARVHQQLEEERVNKKLEEERANKKLEEERVDQQLDEARVDQQLEEERVNKKLEEERVDQQLEEARVDQQLEEERADRKGGISVDPQPSSSVDVYRSIIERVAQVAGQEMPERDGRATLGITRDSLQPQAVKPGAKDEEKNVSQMDPGIQQDAAQHCSRRNAGRTAERKGTLESWGGTHSVQSYC